MSFDKVDEKGKKRYKFLPVASTTSYPASAEKWCVLIGIDTANLGVDARSISIQNASGVVYDQVLMKTFGVAADEIILTLPRRMIVPPNFSVSLSSASAFFLVECASFEDALAIL